MDPVSNAAVPAAAPVATETTQNAALNPTEAQQPTGQAAPAAGEAELYDLPDGRKVDAATLSREWKENFMPDYTRKSQALAAANRANGGQQVQQVQPQQQQPNQYAERPWEDPNYQPQTMAEVFEMNDRRNAYLQQQREAERQQEQQRVDGLIDQQLNEIKAIDPDASPDLVFQHAVKFGFTNLVKAFENMRAFNVAVKKAEDKAVRNVTQRNASGQFAAATVSNDDQPVWGDNSETPQQMLARLTGKK